jgi:hypothetical protein
MRVIQDSDDELDDDVEAGNPPAQEPDASNKEFMTNRSIEPHGTGSTGKADNTPGALA